MPKIDVRALIEQVIDALNRRDAAALAEMSDPEFEFRSRFSEAEGRAYTGGTEGFERYFADLGEAWGEIEWSLDQIVGWNGDDLVLVLRVRGRGRGSGAPFDVLSPQVWSFRNGRPWRNVVFESLEAARDAAGMPE